MTLLSRDVGVGATVGGESGSVFQGTRLGVTFVDKKTYHYFLLFTVFASELVTQRSISHQKGPAILDQSYDVFRAGILKIQPAETYHPACTAACASWTDPMQGQIHLLLLI